MPVNVFCPRCNKELTAPDELVGQTAACPGCQLEFPVQPPDGTAAGSVPMNSTTTGTAAQGDSRPRGNPEQLEHISMSGRNTAMFRGPPSTPSSSVSTPSTTSSSTPPPAPPTTPGQSRLPAGSAAAVSSPPPVQPGSVASSPKSTPALSSSQPSSAPQRRPKPKQAKFVSAEGTSSQIQLGADGQLPRLVLEEGKKQRREEQAESSNPWLLRVVLIVSIGMSGLMLVWNPTSGGGQSKSKQEAREVIETTYATSRGGGSLEPYQLLLGEALQAHSRGETATERRLYRNVLDMLHGEDKNEFTGLTGKPQGPRPSDTDLEALLATLLAED